VGSNNGRWSTAAGTDPLPRRGGPLLRAMELICVAGTARLLLAALFVSPDILQDVL
jgi:hypothetical protein